MTIVLVAFGAGALGALVASSKSAQTAARFFLATAVVGLAIFGLIVLAGRL